MTYDSPMKVKNEMPTGSVICSSGIGAPCRPRWCKALSIDTEAKP